MKHLMIAARAGCNGSMDNVREAFLEQKSVVTKEEYEITLRARKDSADEMKSEQRNRAVEMRDQILSALENA